MKSKSLTPEQETFLAEHDENVRLHFENERLREALESIASGSCYLRSKNPKTVAREALKELE